MKRFILIVLLVLGYRLAVIGADTARQMRFQYYYWEAMRLLQEEQYGEAMDLITFCDKLQPGDAEVSRLLGIYYYNNGRRAEAMQLLEAAYRKAPQNAWYEYATALMQSQDKKERERGLKVLEKTARMLPDRSEVWEQLQSAYINGGQWKECLQVQDTLDKLLGYSIFSAQTRFRLHMAMHKTDEALRDLERYLEEDEQNLQVWILYMQYKEVQGGGLKVMEPIYLKVLRLDPLNATVLNNYAYALVTDKSFKKLPPEERNKQLELAEVMVRRALAHEPENLSYIDTYAWVLHLKGNDELAQIYMRAILDAYQGHKLPKEVKAHAKAIGVK